MVRVSDFLLNRQSMVNLVDPAPDGVVLERLYRMSMRAPDHAQLKPCRWLVFEGETRQWLGAVFREAQLRQRPDTSVDALERSARLPLRAPMVVALVARLEPHPKVPELEQLLSAGCSAFALVLGLEAEGFGGVWRTGEFCYDPWVAVQLELAAQERLVGFIYAGTPAPGVRPKAVAIPSFDERVRYWPTSGERP